MRFTIAAIVVGCCAGLSTAQAADRGEQVYQRACATCHAERMTPAETDRADDMLAPPMNLLTTIIRKKTGNTRDAFVAHVVDFTLAPAREKVKAMPQALDRFGLMPPIQTLHPEITRTDVAAAARWLFERYDYSRELRALQQHQHRQSDH